MKCIQCGADLRPGARFCNVCGTVQPQTEGVESATDAPTTSDESGGRLKRPARVPRPTLAPPLGVEPEDAEAEDAATEDAEVEDSDEASPVDTASATRGVDTPVSLSEAPTEMLSPTPDWENAETAEYTTVAQPLPPASTPEQSSPPVEAPAESSPAWDASGFSWPLPLQIIKGGRYRVEQVISSSEDPNEGENVYRVRDLQGYERCWSCGAEYGTDHANESFCNRCGADLYGRPLRMFERVASAMDEATSATGEDSGAASESTEAGEASSDEEAASQSEHQFVEAGRSYRVVEEALKPSPFPMGPRLLVGMGADVGKTRPGEQNEDSIGVMTLTLGVDSQMFPVALLVVADGMGGHASGQEASRLVVRTLTDYVLRQLALPFLTGAVSRNEASETLKGLLFEAARAANAALCQVNTTNNADSGCTLVATLIVDHTAYIVNVGDSRAYVLDEGELRRITIDHSLVEQLISGGIVKPEERYTHPQRNKIFKSLGDDPELQPDTFEQQLQPGMRLLLCCDGVWEMIRDDELASILSGAPDPQQAADALVARANENGGEDNISAIVLEARL